MPRVERSPPLTPGAELKKVSSDSDVSRNTGDKDFVNVISRSKRARPDSSPTNDWQLFKDEIKSMFESWKKEQDSVLKKITSNIEDVKRQNLELQKSNSCIESSMEFINKSFEEMKHTINKYEKERLEQQNYIIKLEKTVEDLKRGSRSARIEIRNIPQKESETDDDLISVVKNTCDAIQSSINSSDLRDIYRLPGKRDSNRPIIAEFSKVPLKFRVLEASRKFNKGKSFAERLNSEHIGLGGQRIPIFVAEHLPGSMRQLFYEARNFAKLHKYKFCWIYNEKIFLREGEGSKSIPINSVACLKQIQQQTGRN